MKLLKISFCHHLSLSYNGGGEKFIINLAKELARRHEVSIHALPILLDGKPKSNPVMELEGIPYTEALHQKVIADVAYVTYNPLSWLNFRIFGKKIAGMHSETYWKSPNLRYGKYPLIANIINRFTSYTELRRFAAVHRLSDVYPINHPKVYTIPNFVDSGFYAPTVKKNKEFTVAFASRQVWQKGFGMVRALQKRIDIKISNGIPEKDMPSFYSSSHVTIAPALVDTFGLAIVESSLCETPVITTSLPCHRSLSLPLIYSDAIGEYLANIQLLREVWEKEPKKYNQVAKYFRSRAMRFDKREVVGAIEKMFNEVANNA